MAQGKTGGTTVIITRNNPSQAVTKELVNWGEMLSKMGTGTLFESSEFVGFLGFLGEKFVGKGRG